jgi:hypothetical protein
MRVLPWLAKLSFAGFVLSLVIGVAAGFGTRLGFWDFRFGLSVLLRWSIYFGLAGFALGLVWAVWAAIANRGEAARLGAIGLIGSIAVLATPLYGIYVAKTSPAIHDVSTDTEHPPVFVSLMSQRPGAVNPPDYDGPRMAEGPDGKKATTEALQRKYYPDIHSRAELTSPEKLFSRAQKAADDMGWNIVSVVPDEGRIEATDTSFWFGFTDDIVIRVKPAGVGARLDIRSKSRVGTSDIGKNAARIRAYLKKVAATS